MEKKKERWIGIYFPNEKAPGGKNMSLRFYDEGLDKKIWEEIKDKSSTEIKKLIGLQTYDQVVCEAEAQYRTPTNLVKYKLREKFLREKDKQARREKDGGYSL